jgi:hypothetical protein
VVEGFFSWVFLCKLAVSPLNPNMLLWPPFTAQIYSSWARRSSLWFWWRVLLGNGLLLEFNGCYSSSTVQTC